MDEKPVNLVEQDKIVQILELFNSVSRIGKIRVEVFPKWFDNKSHLRITLSKIHKALANYIILLVLAWGNWDDYNRKRRNLKARLRYQKRKEDGTLADKASIKAAMKRDGHKCVITGSDEKLAVHHIDGNRSNNNLDNLVTLSKVVHQVIHNGARAYDDSSLEYWRQRKPEYVLDLKKRMDYKLDIVMRGLNAFQGRFCSGPKNCTRN